eukprot:m.142659 g.142659  ORF g.142659 m.142659 type:complete len:839 (-) comp14975_c0_seq2:657-3173(-)
MEALIAVILGLLLGVVAYLASSARGARADSVPAWNKDEQGRLLPSAREALRQREERERRRAKEEEDEWREEEAAADAPSDKIDEQKEVQKESAAEDDPRERRAALAAARMAQAANNVNKPSQQTKEAANPIAVKEKEKIKEISSYSVASAPEQRAEKVVSKFRSVRAGLGGTVVPPQSHALLSLEELESWYGGDEVNRATEPLAPRTDTRCRFLVTHDMQGGYGQDRHPQGAPGREVFRVPDWQRIDLFVYFSHSLVTLPPPVWTNAAHRAGTRVLGTFITEWDAGNAVCAKLFSSSATATRVATKLAALATHYGFDGWLINIENPVDRAHIPNVIEFLTTLKSLTAASNPAGKVLWYDSVTADGALRWQNELNAANKIFFDACDGIFLNYHWQPQALARSAAVAGPRLGDVFAGIDVFGRGTFGGGGFQCNTAVSAIAAARLSIALFAPGWVFEHFDGKNLDENQKKFWAQFDSLPPRVVSALPFSTSFCKGVGSGVWLAGKRVLSEPWRHLSAQDPSLYSFPTDRILFPGHGMAAAFPDISLVEDDEIAWSGGSSLRLAGHIHAPAVTAATTTPLSPPRCVVRLFMLQAAAPGPICISYTVRCVGPVSSSLVLVCHPRGTDPRYLVLEGPDSSGTPGPAGSEGGGKLFEKYGVHPSPLIGVDGEYMRFAPCPAAALLAADPPALGWQTRHYVLLHPAVRDRTIGEIRFEIMSTLAAGRAPFSVHIGHVGLTHVAEHADFARTAVGEIQASAAVLNGSRTSVSTTLTWRRNPAASHYHVLNTTTGQYLGRAYTHSFQVLHMPLGETREHSFRVVPVSRAGLLAPADACGEAHLCFTG